MQQICTVGIDVGLTMAKAAAFDRSGRELVSFGAPNPRIAVMRDRQEIDMDSLWETVAGVLRRVTIWLEREGWQVAAVGQTGHGNGLYLVDERLRPVRPAIASTDTRAESLVARLEPAAVERMRRSTGSVPWAAQPAVLLRWLHDHEEEAVSRSRWALSCKDWIACCLTGSVSADCSDASACGLVALRSREYDPAALETVGLPSSLLGLFPDLSESNEVVGRVNGAAAAATGLAIGTPVVAGCMDCVASPIGAGSVGEGDVTVIVGTWAINSVVVPVADEPPRVTLNALLPEPGFMLAQEVAPTSVANLEWLSTVLAGAGAAGIDPRRLMEAAAAAAPGAGGILFLPFIHGSPEHLGSSGALLGLRGDHRYPEIARAVAEGITQYHRAQLQRLRNSGATVSQAPWTLAGGGAKNEFWAQMFADIAGHAMRRQLQSELGARGAALLAAQGAGIDTADWNHPGEEDGLLVRPGPDREVYRQQAEAFDRCVGSMRPIWSLFQGEERP